MKLRAVVIGLGHGQSYLHILRGHKDFELVGVVDRDQARLSRIGTEYGIKTFTDIDQLINAKAADVVFIALPTPFHADVSIACLNAGMHVLLEKPLCRTDDEAVRIGVAVARSGKAFQVGYEVRSSPMHQAVIRHARNGDLGRVTNVWYNQHTLDKFVEQDWRASRANMGGKLFDCAVHYLDLMQQWAGAPVHRIVAMGHLIDQLGPCREELPQSAAIAVEYANGVRGTYNFGAVNVVNDDSSFGVVGTTGRIMGNPWLPEGAGSFELRTHKGVIKSNAVFDGKLTSTGHLGFKEQVYAFADTILRGGPNACSIDDAIGIHAQMVAIDRSLASGQIIEIREALAKVG